jgi:hypothetical protein
VSWVLQVSTSGTLRLRLDDELLHLLYPPIGLTQGIDLIEIARASSSLVVERGVNRIDDEFLKDNGSIRIEGGNAECYSAVLVFLWMLCLLWGGYSRDLIRHTRGHSEIMAHVILKCYPRRLFARINQQYLGSKSELQFFVNNLMRFKIDGSVLRRGIVGWHFVGLMLDFLLTPDLQVSSTRKSGHDNIKLILRAATKHVLLLSL